MPNSKAVLGIVGEIAAGKGVAAKYLQKKYGAEIFKFSASMRDVAARLYLEPTRQNIQGVSTAMRGAFGDDLFAKVMAKDVAASDADLIITDGIRRPSDIVELAKFPYFHLIAIVADEKTRYGRVKARNENEGDSEKTWEQFLTDAQAETELRIRDIASKAEFTINNNGTIDDLHQNLDAIMSKIKNLPA
jgi:dephospho-CoA kinase